MYDSSKGMLIGFIIAILIVGSLGFSVKEYKPKFEKRKKYKLVKMKILPKKKEKVVPPKKEVKKEVKKDIKPQKVEKKEKIIIKKKKKKYKKKKKIQKKKVVAKNPINKKKEEAKKEKPKEKAPPVFGVTMNSVSKTGTSGFKVKVGNTLMTDDKTGWENGKPKKIGKFVGEADEAQDGSNEPEDSGPPPKIVTKPIPKKVFRPKYTKLAEEEEIEGKIILSLTIDKKGNVIKAKIIKGLGYGLDENALKAVKKFKFLPAVLSNGKTKKTRITYTINFILEE